VRQHPSPQAALQALARQGLEHLRGAGILFAKLYLAETATAKMLFEDAFFSMPELSVDVRLQEAAYLRT
jgi:hypothetical protein